MSQQHWFGISGFKSSSIRGGKQMIGNIVCGLCEKRFPSRRSLNGHMNSSHLHQKPYQCEWCDKSFAHQTSLHFHKRLCQPKLKNTS